MSDNAGRMLENIVYLELKRYHQEIYFHREKHECNFIIQEGWILMNDETEEFVLSVDEKRYVVHVLPVWRWLIAR